MNSPTERTGLHIAPTHTPDGRILHRFRQSQLNELDTCLERNRLKLVGAYDDTTTDAAATGTAVHAGIETTVEIQMEDGFPLALDSAIEVAQDEFTKLVAQPDFRWVQQKEKAARLFIGRAMESFYVNVLPELQPEYTELSFGPLILHEDDKRVIEVTGTIDYGDYGWGTSDWKTASRKYEKWEKERWAIQPTVYLWALWKMGRLSGDGPWPFTFIIFLKGGAPIEVQRITVYRHQGDFQWLREKAVALAELIEADLSVWPKNDTHALCSPTWCPAWDQCKGKHYTPEWPKPSEPSELWTQVQLIPTMLSER